MRHLWKVDDENDKIATCQVCGASFMMDGDQYVDWNRPMDDLASRHGILKDCDKEKVRQVMES